MPLLVLAVSYCLVGYAVEAAFDLPGRMRNVWFEGTYLVYPTLVLLSFPFAFAAHRWTIRDREGRWIPGLAGWKAAWSGEGVRFITPSRVVGVVIVAALTPFFLSTYGSWKSMIPDLQPFGWDTRISSLDRCSTSADCHTSGSSRRSATLRSLAPLTCSTSCGCR